MNSERIEVGDLVMVVKPVLCCGFGGGHIFTVTGLMSNAERYGPREWTHAQCRHCGELHEIKNIAAWMAGISADGHPSDIFGVTRLKRIPPPLSEPSHTETHEETSA